MSETSTAPEREAPMAGVVTKLTPRVRRLVAPNPSPFTFTGTCSYLIGEGDVAILDPGPDSDAQFAALLEATRGEKVAAIVITHTHRDHSPLARRLSEATSAPIVGARPHVFTEGPQQGLDASHDARLRARPGSAGGRRTRRRRFDAQAIETPGHAANHLVFACPEENALFSGDHVMAWSTSVVAPPDGSMTDYMASLEKLRGRSEAVYWPGHGGAVTDPQRYLRALIGHRRQREAAILDRIDGGVTTLIAIVDSVYAGLDPKLVGARPPLRARPSRRPRKAGRDC